MVEVHCQITNEVTAYQFQPIWIQGKIPSKYNFSIARVKNRTPTLRVHVHVDTCKLMI